MEMITQKFTTDHKSHHTCYLNLILFQLILPKQRHRRRIRPNLHSAHVHNQATGSLIVHVGKQASEN